MTLLLDTDIGTDSDDAVALTVALASPEIEIVGVTTVSGDTRVRAQIARRLLDLGNRPDVPVYAGCPVPRTSPPPQRRRHREGPEFAWFGYEGDGILDPNNAPHIPDEHAIHALIRLLRRHDDLEVVAIGPLTNIASALIQAPDIAQRIKRLTIMGGYIRHVACGGGIISPMVDYNLRIDPESTRIVLTSDIPMQLIPIDVTVQVWMPEAQLRDLEQSDSELLRSVARNIRHWSPIQQKIFTTLGARMQPDNVGFLHDPSHWHPSSTKPSASSKTSTSSSPPKTRSSAPSNADTRPPRPAASASRPASTSPASTNSSAIACASPRASGNTPQATGTEMPALFIPGSRWRVTCYLFSARDEDRRPAPARASGENHRGGRTMNRPVVLSESGARARNRNRTLRDDVKREIAVNERATTVALVRFIAPAVR